MTPNFFRKPVVQSCDLGDSATPSYLRKKLAGFPGSKLWFIGNPNILKKPLVGLFCSIRCPGNVILQTYDLARGLREAWVPVIGGFHSPMEKECLDLLLRGQQPVVVCPARSLAKMRIPKDWREPLAEGRLLVLSPFEEKHKRAIATLAAERNRLVSILANEFFIPYGARGSKTELLCRDLVNDGKPVYTFPLEEPEALAQAGAEPIQLDAYLKKRRIISSPV
jgi:predicted Rossmann fold nucleotide-binding protein DprA/Smf involved in DNA uptake